jgi:hypothetical protein
MCLKELTFNCPCACNDSMSGNEGTAQYILNAGTRQEKSASHPGHFTPLETKLSICSTGTWVDPSVGLDASENQ